MSNDGPKGSHKGASASSTVGAAPPPRLISSDSSDCSNCDGKKIPSDELVCCFVCQQSFHALCFVLNANDTRKTYLKDNTCSQTCLKHFKQAQAAKNSSKHFGSFVFVCDICLTTKEQEKAKDVISHVSNLEQKILSMESDLTTIKNLLCENKSNALVATPQVIQPENPWCDTERVKKLRHPATMIIHDTSGENVPLKSLESIITNNNIEANNTFKNREGNTVITLSSQQDRSKLVNAIKENYPNSDIRQPNEKLPTISIAGIKEDISSDTLRDQILTVYQEVKDLVDAGETFTVLSVKQQRNYSGANKLYQASIRVSNSIRKFIENRDNYLSIGLYRCKVYDHFYIKRCNRCQKYGHYKAQCRATKPVCAQCSGNHDTTDCPEMSKPSFQPVCVNCFNAKENSQQHTHSAADRTCPTYQSEQNKLKKSISYYAQKNF